MGVARLGIRRTVVLAAAVALGIALFAGALILRAQLHDALERSIGEQTLTRARGVAALVETGDFARTLKPDDRTPAWVQVVDDRGRVIASTPNIEGLPTPFAPVQSGRRASLRRLHGLVIDTGERVAVAAVPVRAGGRRLTILAASPLDLAAAADRRVIISLAVVFPVLLVVGCAVVSAAAGRSLRPVEAIRSEVASITSSDTARRVPVPNSNDEVAHLATTMNTMLDRLDAAASRQRRFLADVGHELRSPLTSLGAQLDGATNDETREHWTASVNDMKLDHQRLERLVTDLLLLARHDEGERLGREPLDLGYLVRAHVAGRAAVPGVERSVRALNILVNANADALTRVLRNLLDNAERHARTRIEVAVGPAVGSGGESLAELVVNDDGPGVAAGDQQLVFERFVRLDEARTADAGGSGLGLAIVAELVRELDGSIRIDADDGGQPSARFVVRLPLLVGGGTHV